MIVFRQSRQACELLILSKLIKLTVKMSSETDSKPASQAAQQE
jgi:hypothetical protein